MHKKKLTFYDFLPYILIVIVGITGLIYTESVRKEHNQALSVLNANIINLNDKLNSVAANISSEINLLDTMLQNSRKENKQKFDSLVKIMQEVEQKSNLQLEELKKEVASVNVESAGFSGIIQDVLPSVVSVLTNKGQGSGAIIGEDGYIVTNLHVINGAYTIRVLTNDQEMHDAQVIGANSLTDVAVLKIEGSFDKLGFYDSDDVKVGEKVIALGNPGGLDFSVTEGIVSAVHRTDRNGVWYIQTDVPINPGNSGGPLVNSKGKIIGINNWKISGFEGVGFAIESNIVENDVDEIIRKYEEGK